jgi:UDPglucose 6-dehydrogenase
MVELAAGVLGDPLAESTVAVLGAAFKPDSDDTRDSPALDIAGHLQSRGATVRVFDPKAMENARKNFPLLEYSSSLRQACEGAHLTLVLTEWQEFRQMQPSDLDGVVRERRIIDGRNCLDMGQWRNAGWDYRGIGRP